MSPPARGVSVEERRRRLALRHHLAHPGAPIVDVAGELLGLHASDPVSVYLSALARYPELTIKEMERALYEQRSLLKVLGMRRTMFVVPPNEAALIDAACTRALSAVQHRRLQGMLESQDVTSAPAAWIAEMGERVVDDLQRNGEATAKELVRRLPELDVRLVMSEGSAWATEVSVVSRLLLVLSIDLRIVRGRPLGSWLSSQYRWAATDSWAPGTIPTMETPEARTELVRRWLSAYGPGTTADLVWWTGLTKRVVVEALSRAGAVEVALDGATGWLMPDDLDAPRPDDQPWVALLPALDSTVMGWRNRDWYLEPTMVPRLFDRNGNAGPTIWVSGRVVGGWAQRRDGTVAIGLLERVNASTRRLIDKRARHLTDWFAGTVATPRFRTPLERDLNAA